MKHASTLPEGQNYKIYADNYFSCIPLVVQLLHRGIHYVGTARQVRLPNCNLADEKSLKKSGRGSFDLRVEGNHNICVVKWFDNRAVTLVSSFAGPEPVQKIKHWDKATKTYTEVERPYIVRTYNRFMGGVDLLDSLAAKYKFRIKIETVVLVNLLTHHYSCCDQCLAPLQARLHSAQVFAKRDAEKETVSGRTSRFSYPGEHNSN
ncbi:piggyBac transposable element-derived protein 2-like [Myxocyprinus asiaticus]|uniref:piggyBac transposable element-derived protein 2-like n=1 Tax=Myxocyprinus asiaticus TaxID=70543 RepID=UPI002221F350|nr:piggyBac transposable element-derived protein 2-like [Myxocyprinus asiaticus]